MILVTLWCTYSTVDVQILLCSSPIRIFGFWITDGVSLSVLQTLNMVLSIKLGVGLIQKVNCDHHSLISSVMTSSLLLCEHIPFLFFATAVKSTSFVWAMISLTMSRLILRVESIKAKASPRGLSIEHYEMDLWCYPRQWRFGVELMQMYNVHVYWWPS